MEPVNSLLCRLFGQLILHELLIVVELFGLFSEFSFQYCLFHFIRSYILQVSILPLRLLPIHLILQNLLMLLQVLPQLIQRNRPVFCLNAGQFFAPLLRLLRLHFFLPLLESDMDPVVFTEAWDTGNDFLRAGLAPFVPGEGAWVVEG